MFATAKMSTKGQIVIPENIREEMGLQAGVEFILITEGDSVILKKLYAPSNAALKNLLDTANRNAKKAGITLEEIENVTSDYRKEKRARRP